MSEEREKKNNFLKNVLRNKKVMAVSIIFFILFIVYIYFVINYICSYTQIKIDEITTTAFMCTKRKISFRKNNLIYDVTISKEFLEGVCK